MENVAIWDMTNGCLLGIKVDHETNNNQLKVQFHAKIDKINVNHKILHTWPSVERMLPIYTNFIMLAGI